MGSQLQYSTYVWNSAPELLHPHCNKWTHTISTHFGDTMHLGRRAREFGRHKGSHNKTLPDWSPLLLCGSRLGLRTHRNIRAPPLTAHRAGYQNLPCCPIGCSSARTATYYTGYTPSLAGGSEPKVTPRGNAICCLLPGIFCLSTHWRVYMGSPPVGCWGLR